MILTREQINRYLRHIIIPEISGPGQKKLLDSSVFVCGESVNGVAPAVYYLAASGVGRIYCHFDDARGFEQLFADIHDLNDDVSIERSDGSHSDVWIFLGKPEFITHQDKRISTDSVPSIICLHSGWKGGMEVFTQKDGLNLFLARLSKEYPPSDVCSDNAGMSGEVFSTCLLGALSAMETIKLALGIGKTADDFLAFNLLSMEFVKVNEAELTQRLHDLHAPQGIDCPEAKLKGSKVLIVGTGGLGSPVAYALALAGVGTIGLVDYDNVEISNLNRQILHSASRIGLPKVESAAVFLKNINPYLHIYTHNTSLSKENVFEIIEGYDIVVDALDNFPTRFLLNDACFFAKKPLVDAGVIRFDGTFMTILNPEGPCYRCRYRDIPAPGSTPSCSETGVLGPIPGIMGFMQAAEVVKLLSGKGNILSDRIIFFDGLFSNFCTIKLNKKNNCPLCGTAPTILELQEYEFICTDA